MHNAYFRDQLIVPTNCIEMYLRVSGYSSVGDTGTGCARRECMVKAVRRRICAQCKDASYCSKECQKEHWKVHKHICKHIALLRDIL